MGHSRHAVVDFDNTISGYDHWRGTTVLGPPIPYAKDAILELMTWGWEVIVFTTRASETLISDWLRRYEFPALLINSTAHNPANTSNKPIAEAYFDDRDAHCVGELPYNWHKAMKRVRKIYQPGLTTDIDDASAWASWYMELVVAPRVRREFAAALPGRLDAEEVAVGYRKPACSKH